MLQKATEEVAVCLRQAAEAEARANLTNDAKSKADYQLIADTWRKLAEHNQFQESLERFISLDHSRRKALLPVSPAGTADAEQAAELTSHQDAVTVLPAKGTRVARRKAQMGGESMTAQW